jgi:hypothetical protein
MADGNLVDAKRMYISRLSEIVSPFVLNFIDSTYKSAKTIAGNRKSLLEFQRQLRDVPNWNSQTVSAYTRSIEAKYTYFSNLVAAVFVSYVKVLSSIKLGSDRPNIKLKLPSNDTFVHQVFVQSAKNFYDNPHCAADKTKVKAAMVQDAIETAVRNLLPLGDVLTAYLSTAVNDDNTINPKLSPAHSSEEIGDDDDDDDDDDEIESIRDEEEKIVHFPQNPPMASYAPPPADDGFPAPPVPAPLPVSDVQDDYPPQAPPQPPPYQAPHALPHQAPQQTPPALFDDAADGDRHFR